MRRILHLAVHDTKLFLLAKENFFFKVDEQKKARNLKVWNM